MLSTHTYILLHLFINSSYVTLIRVHETVVSDAVQLLRLCMAVRLFSNSCNGTIIAIKGQLAKVTITS